MKNRRLIETVHLPTVERSLRRQESAGELLPALPEDVRRPDPGAIIRINLPPARLEENARTEYETRKPQRAATWESDVKVPLAQAALTACAFGLGAGLVTWAAGWSWRVPVVTFTLVLTGAWLWRLRLVDSLLWSIESVIERDVTGDGNIGKPSRPYTLANPHEARQTAAKSQRDQQAEERRAALVRFLHTCYVTGTSEAAHGIEASGPDRAAYVEARDVLLSLGIAQWRNVDRPRAGWTMTVSEAEALTIMSRHLL